MKKVLLIIVISLSGCSYMYDNIEIHDLEVAVRLSMIEVINDSTLKAYAYAQGASRIEIVDQGHCYLFNSTKLPDTTDFVSPGVGNTDSFHSIIGYSSGDDSLYIRAYIVFGDSIVYSQIGKQPLNK